jgi:hypothetical protein
MAEKRFFDAFFVPAFRQRPVDPRCGRFLQVVMNRTLTDRTSAGNLPLPQPEFKAEAKDPWSYAWTISWLAPCLSRKSNRRNSLPSVMSSATPPLWKSFRGIVITVPECPIN